MEKSSILSIAIPSYDHPKTPSHLGQLLQSIALQDYADSLKIYISFHTNNARNYLEFLEFIKSFKLDIVPFRNSKNFGNWISNTNYLLSKIPSTHHVKILFQDDILIRVDALSKISKLLQNDTWIASGFTHFQGDSIYFHAPGKTLNGNVCVSTFYDSMVPRYDSRMPFELINFIGAPSVITLPPNHQMKFDKRFIFSGDVEFYHRLQSKYGAPLILPEIQIGIRRHNNSVTTNLSNGIEKRMPDGRKVRNLKDLHAREVILMKRKYGFPLEPHEMKLEIIKLIFQNVKLKWCLLMKTCFRNPSAKEQK